MVFIFTPTFGEDSLFGYDFSNGLKPPTSCEFTPGISQVEHILSDSNNNKGFWAKNTSSVYAIFVYYLIRACIKPLKRSL